jgi:hypothetical protein
VVVGGGGGRDGSVLQVVVVGGEGGGLPPSGTRLVDGDGNARSDDLASSGIEGVNI